MLYEQDGQLPADLETIAFEMRSQYERIAEVLQTNLFYLTPDGLYYRSSAVDSRIAEINRRRLLAVEAAERRWNKGRDTNALPMQSEPIAKPLPTQCGRNANPMLERKKESIERKESKEREYERERTTTPQPPVQGAAQKNLKMTKKEMASAINAQIGANDSIPISTEDPCYACNKPFLYHSKEQTEEDYCLTSCPSGFPKGKKEEKLKK